MLKRAAGLLLAAVLGSVGWASAQTYPTRVIRIIVPQSAGGSTDLVARPIAKIMAESLGQPVIVDNRPGAGSIVGCDAVAKSPPDGYTLLMVAASFSISPSLVKQLPYDAVRDFSPITQISAFPNILVVRASSPIKSVAEFIAYAKANPGKLNYGSSGIGTGTHLSTEMLKYMAGIDMVHVPYKGDDRAALAFGAGSPNLVGIGIDGVRLHLLGRAAGSRENFLRHRVPIVE